MARNKRRQKPPKPHVAALPARRIFVGIPTYSGNISLATHLSLASETEQVRARGWELSVWMRSLDSVIARARNVIFSAFLESDFTDLIFLDADIGFQAGAITRLVEHPVDIVGGAYRSRQDAEIFILRTFEGEMHIDAVLKLLEVEAVATGFMRISRAAAEKMREEFADRWYRDSTAPQIEKIYNVFDFEYHDHQYWTEDYVFCKRWRALGGKIWVDPILELSHTGEKTWTGCLLEYMNRCCKVPDAQSTGLRQLAADLPQPPSLAQVAKTLVEAAA